MQPFHRSPDIKPYMQLTIRDPHNGEILGQLNTATHQDIAQSLERSSRAQQEWCKNSVEERAKKLLRLRQTLVNRADEIAELISRENGKPKFEALVGEVMPCLDFAKYFAFRAPELLKSKRLRIGMPWIPHRYSYVEYAPLGVVAIISPWNFPLLLPFAEMIMAVVSGNSVILKPSEITPLIGCKIAELFNQSGFPENLVQAIIGDGSVGAELIRQKPNKIFFTGSVATGKKVMAAAAEYLIPVNLELGGKDAMIIRQDADLELATSAALWGSCFNLGQACASVERILVHQSIAKRFSDLLSLKMKRLRVGSPLGLDSDLGVITFEKQKQIYETHLHEARTRGVQFVTGGNFSTDRKRLEPTLVTGSEIEKLQIYNEETFGPVVALSTFSSDAEAIAKANASRYGLTASIFSRDHRGAEKMASQLEAGTVTINEVLYTAGLPGTPWGGWKNSGIGRTHHDEGLYEFTQLRHIHSHHLRWTARKSLWWYPYGLRQYELFRGLVELHKRGFLNKMVAILRVMKNLIAVLWKEPRI